jgi:hypothetical protein
MKRAEIIRKYISFKLILLCTNVNHFLASQVAIINCRYFATAFISSIVFLIEINFYLNSNFQIIIILFLFNRFNNKLDLPINSLVYLETNEKVFSFHRQCHHYSSFKSNNHYYGRSKTDRSKLYVLKHCLKNPIFHFFVLFSQLLYKKMVHGKF